METKLTTTCTRMAMAEPDAAQSSRGAAADADDTDHDIETGECRSCPVCTEAAEWVAIGPCGHREVCVNCAVRMRFFDRNFRCSICRAFCPTVVITKAAATVDDDATTFSRPSTAFGGGAGRVGVYFWFHGGAAAYFDDQEQYEAVRRMCLRRRNPVAAHHQEEACVDPMFVFYVVGMTLLGTASMTPIIIDLQHWYHRVGVVLGCVVFCVAFACLAWRKRPAESL